jgi:hypothetical protein
LCIIANASVTEPAIQSRALMLYFDPSNEEIHRQAARWFWEQEIHDWIGARLARLHPLDARAYLHCDNDKLGQRDWRRLFLEANAIDAVECLVQDLETDPAYPTAKDRVRRFAEILGSAGGSRSNYYSVRRRLQKDGRLLTDPTVGVIPLVRAGKRPLTRTLSADSTPALPAPDVPVRESFVRPVSGSAGTATPQPRMSADDTTSWERPTDDEDDEDDVGDVDDVA